MTTRADQKQLPSTQGQVSLPVSKLAAHVFQPIQVDHFGVSENLQADDAATCLKPPAGCLT